MSITDCLRQQRDEILAANAQDMAATKANNLTTAMQDSLLLTTKRLDAIVEDVTKVCQLVDPVGRILDGGLLDNGLNIQRRCVPLGVIGVIYEARPNVTIDVVSLCLKTGNTVILRDGKETSQTNQAIVKVIQHALQQNNLPLAAVQAINDPDEN